MSIVMGTVAVGNSGGSQSHRHSPTAAAAVVLWLLTAAEDKRSSPAARLNINTLTVASVRPGAGGVPTSICTG